MQISFGVAVAMHFAGANVSDLLPKRFPTYDDADQYAESYKHDCVPTIFVILNEEHAFYCTRSAVKNEPYEVYCLALTEEGYNKTGVWWEDFVRNPEKFIHLGQRIPPEVTAKSGGKT